MQIFEYGAGPHHRAPLPDGPVVEILSGTDTDDRQLAAARVQIPAGGAMPEHDHGESETLVVPLEGDLVLSSDENAQKLHPGVIVRVGRGERVRVENQGGHTAVMLAVFAPPAFINRLAAWPAA